jgi:hypothetical protein
LPGDEFLNTVLIERLNQINRTLESKDFLASAGLGNELAFYIFDYPPEEELEVRRFVELSLEYLSRRNIKVAHINLFQLVIQYLQKRKLLDSALLTQKKKGDAELLKALRGPMNEERLAQTFVETANPTNCQLVMLTGVGSAWPVVRTHTLLNALHPHMGGKPLVVFYPGKYDGQYLSLFGRLERRYYRAFRLIP